MVFTLRTGAILLSYSALIPESTRRSAPALHLQEHYLLSRRFVWPQDAVLLGSKSAMPDRHHSHCVEDRSGKWKQLCKGFNAVTMIRRAPY